MLNLFQHPGQDILTCSNEDADLEEAAKQNKSA